MPETSTGLRQRRSLRYKGYDYTAPGAYFVTICAFQGRCSFGQITEYTMIGNPVSQIVERCWAEIPQHYPQVALDESTVMPNHVHGILWITEGESSESARTGGHDPVQRKFGEPIAGSLSTMIGTYKAAVTRQAKDAGLIPGPPLWHGRFWDRIIRVDKELAHIRDYIRSNPARWVEDQLHPNAPPNQFNQWQP